MTCKTWNCTISELGCAKRHYLAQLPSSVVTHHDVHRCKDCKTGKQSLAQQKDHIGKIKGVIYTKQAPSNKRAKRGMSAYTFHYAL